MTMKLITPYPTGGRSNMLHRRRAAVLPSEQSTIPILPQHHLHSTASDAKISETTTPAPISTNSPRLKRRKRRRGTIEFTTEGLLVLVLLMLLSCMSVVVVKVVTSRNDRDAIVVHHDTIKVHINVDKEAVKADDGVGVAKEELVYNNEHNVDEKGSIIHNNRDGNIGDSAVVAGADKQVQDNESEANNVGIVVPENDESIAVFYNVFTKTKEDVAYVRSIVKEQLSYRRPQHKVFVRSIGTPFNIDNTIRVQHDEKGDEAETLHLIWKYCRDRDRNRPSEKVVYIHTKGSFHQSIANGKLRRFLTRGALSEECEALPSTCNVCSSRMSPVPHPHTSGNMWLARCDYISKLIDPLEFAVRMNDVKLNAAWDIQNQVEQKNQYACAGKGRYAAEHWVHSHPTVMPCDLSTDNTFVWNYKNVPDENFEIDLQPAPRFDLKTYDIVRNTCQKYGFVEEDRLNEYQVLYGEDAPKSWWGWKLYLDPQRLWFGEAIQTSVMRGGSSSGSGGNPAAKIHTLEVVVAYCQADLHWMHDALLDSSKLASIGITNVKMTILSKCGNEHHVPDFSENFSDSRMVSEVNIITLPNVGGCDYAYAHFINEYVSRHTMEDALSSVILFIKDTPRTKKYFHFGYHSGYRNVEDMVRIAASGKFACGIQTNCDISPYHEVASLNRFIISSYTRIAIQQAKGVKEKVSDDFNIHGYENLRDFHDRALNWTFPDTKITPVCYGGTFALPASRLIALSNQSDEKRVLERLEDILSRKSKAGTTVEEHFVERTWAGLFAIPLTEDEIGAVLAISRGSGKSHRRTRDMDTGVYGAFVAEKSQCSNSRQLEDQHKSNFSKLMSFVSWWWKDKVYKRISNIR